MPPQPKKSRILASTSRQGNRQSHIQVERSEDEDEVSDTADTMESEAEYESQELETSSAKKNGQIGQIMEDVVDAQRHRRKVRKENVLKSYDDAYTTVQSSIATLFDEHEKQSAAVHRAQLKALTDLLAEKAKLEASMEAKLADLRESYDMHSRDLEAALATKIKDLE